ncbi:MAG: suppressor of fused domain protein [Clostridiales bacterium]|nr:suppressor of fused domain protein [Clostridiales bacterium]
MENSDLGEIILQHYEKYLGTFENREIYENNETMPSIQMIQYRNIFEGCKTYASLGLSKFSEEINNTCEIVMSIDNDYEKASYVLANVLFYIVLNKLDFGRGTYIGGIENIDSIFVDQHKKSAIYFTETYAFPDEFSHIRGNAKMYMAFFISQEEYDFIKKNGCEKFEEYLEEKEIDIMHLDR